MKLVMSNEILKIDFMKAVDALEISKKNSKLCFIKKLGLDKIRSPNKILFGN